MTPKPQANTVDEMPVFGDKVSIEQFRYGADNEFYTHKVIGTLKSNTYADVPQTGGYEQYIHKEVVDVVQVICEGISEDKVLRYPVARVKILGHRQALITEARIDEHKVFWEIVPSDAEHVETLKDISNYRLIKLRAELND